jgi:hemoglobin-like flavoprotein
LTDTFGWPYPGQRGKQELCMSNVTNWPARFAEMVDFVGLSEEDRQLIKASAPIILAHAGRMTDCVYDSLLKYPQARQFFVTEDDEPDAKRIEANKQTMISWLRASAAAPSNEGFIRYLVGISQMHENIPVHRPELSPVAPRYIIGTISYYQTAIADILLEKMPNANLAARTSRAWNKWLMVMLELLLANYLMHDTDA